MPDELQLLVIVLVVLLIGLGFCAAIRPREVWYWQESWNIKEPEKAQPTDYAIWWVRFWGITGILFGVYVIVCLIRES